MQSIVQKARANVRFLPIFLTIVGMFVIPVTLYHGQVVTTEAHAFLGFDLKNTMFEILAFIPMLIFRLASLIFILSGWLFDYALDLSTKGSTYSNMVFINTAWTFIRDLINSGFIFAVLTIAFKQLLKTSEVDTSSLQKTLLNIIIAALLINFSLFFTKVIIDASNVVSRGIYYRISTVAPGGGEVKYGPAHALSQGLNLFTVLEKEKSDVSPLNMVIIYGGGTIMMLISSMLFFAAAFMFIARIFMLMVLMMTSPLLFASMALSNFSSIKKWRDKWWGALKAQALFPVIYLLVIYIAVMFVRSDSFTLKNYSPPVSLAKAFEGGPGGSASLILLVNYFIVTALMVYALKLGRDAAGSETNKLGGAFQQKFLGAQAAFGRNVLGRIGKATASSSMVKGMTSGSSRFGRFAGDKLVRAGQYAAESSFDVRASKIAQRAAGAAGENLGKASTSTFAKDGGRWSRAAGNQIAAVSAGGSGRMAKMGQGLGSGLQKFAGDEGGEGGREAAQKARDKRNAEAIAARYASDANSMAAQIRDKFGDKAFEGKGGEANRKAVIDSIEKKFKDKPGEKGAALKAAFGGSFDTSGDFKGIRAKLEKETRAENAKKVLTNKDTQKDASSYKEDAHKTAIANAEKAKQESGENSPAHKEALKQVAEFDKKQGARKEMAEAAKSAKPEDVADLDVDTLVMLSQSNALNQKALKAIEEKLKDDSAYLEADKKRINDMAKDMLMHGNEETVKYLKASANKGTSGFDLDMTGILEAARDNGNDAEMRRALGNMSDVNARSLDGSLLFDPKVIWHASPPVLAAYVKRADATGDPEMYKYIQQGIATLKSGNAPANASNRVGGLLQALEGKKAKEPKAPKEPKVAPPPPPPKPASKIVDQYGNPIG